MSTYNSTLNTENDYKKCHYMRPYFHDDHGREATKLLIYKVNSNITLIHVLSLFLVMQHFLKVTHFLA